MPWYGLNNETTGAKLPVLVFFFTNYKVVWFRNIISMEPDLVPTFSLYGQHSILLDIVYLSISASVKLTLVSCNRQTQHYRIRKKKPTVIKPIQIVLWYIQCKHSMQQLTYEWIMIDFCWSSRDCYFRKHSDGIPLWWNTSHR